MLPETYLSFLEASKRIEPEAGRVWIGETGFRVPESSAQAEVWVRALAGGRRSGMHPDLVPFATDGVGNRYCFYCSSRPELGHIETIVFWVLDTARAIPIAENFGAFLDWMGMVAHWTAMRGDDSIVDDAHLREIVDPILRALGRPSEPRQRVRSREATQRDLLASLLDVQPASPVGLIWKAMGQLEQSDTSGALLSCERALRVFPEHVMARLLEADAHLREGSTAARLGALTQAIRMPLVYGGDEQLPYVGKFPALDPAWLAEELATAPLPADDLMFEPIWDLILAYDPTTASGWLTVSVEYANLEQMEVAITMATNALLFALPEERTPVLSYLSELYSAAGADWHASLTTAEAERPAPAVVPRRD